MRVCVRARERERERERENGAGIVLKFVFTVNTEFYNFPLISVRDRRKTV